MTANNYNEFPFANWLNNKRELQKEKSTAIDKNTGTSSLVTKTVPVVASDNNIPFANWMDNNENELNPPITKQTLQEKANRAAQQSPVPFTAWRAGMDVREAAKGTVRNLSEGVLHLTDLFTRSQYWNKVVNSDDINTMVPTHDESFLMWAHRNGSPQDPGVLSPKDLTNLKRQYAIHHKDIYDNYHKSLSAAEQYIREKLKADPEYLKSTGFLEDSLKMGLDISKLVALTLATGGTATLAEIGLETMGSTTENLMAQGADKRRAEIAGMFNGIVTTGTFKVMGIADRGAALLQKGIVNRFKFLSQRFGKDFATGFALRFPEAAAEVWAKTPDKTVLEQIKLWADDIASGKIPKEAIKSGAVFGAFGTVMGMLTPATKAKSTTEAVSRKDVGPLDVAKSDHKDGQTIAPGKILLTDNKTQSTPIKDFDKRVNTPRVKSLIGGENIPTKQGYELSDEPTVTNEQRAHSIENKDSVRNFFGNDITDKNMIKTQQKIVWGEDRIKNLWEFYSNAVNEGDHESALKIAQQIHQETNDVAQLHIKMMDDANAKADRNDTVVDPQRIDAVQQHVNDIITKSAEAVKAQKSAVDALRYEKNQEFMDNLETNEGFKQNLISESVKARNNGNSKLAVLYDKVSTEMNLQERMGSDQYFEKTPLQKLVKIKVELGKESFASKQNPNVNQVELAMHDRMAKWINDVFIQKNEYNRKQLAIEEAQRQTRGINEPIQPKQKPKTIKKPYEKLTREEKIAAARKRAQATKIRKERESAIQRAKVRAAGKKLPEKEKINIVQKPAIKATEPKPAEQLRKESIIVPEKMSILPEHADKAKELFKSAAIKIGDKIYTGKSHIDVLIHNKDVADFVEKATPRELKHSVYDGFVTHDGKFVQRDKAADLVGVEGGKLLYSEDFIKEMREAAVARNKSIGRLNQKSVPAGRKDYITGIKNSDVDFNRGEHIRAIITSERGNLQRVTKRLLQVSGTPVEIVDNVERLVADGKVSKDMLNNWDNTGGFYSHSLKKIFINGRALGKRDVVSAQKTLAHEALHAAIDKFFISARNNRPKLFIDSMHKIRNWAQDLFFALGDKNEDWWGKQDKYVQSMYNALVSAEIKYQDALSKGNRNNIIKALAHYEEAITYTFTNPEVAKFLNTIDAPQKIRTNIIRTMWDYLVNKMLEVVGVRIRKSSSLSALTKIANETLNLDKEVLGIDYTPEFKARLNDIENARRYSYNNELKKSTLKRLSPREINVRYKNAAKQATFHADKAKNEILNLDKLDTKTLDLREMTLSPEEKEKTNTRSVGETIYDIRDETRYNIQRATDEIEQQFLAKFGGKFSKLKKLGVSSGKLVNTKDTELLQKAMNLYIDSGKGDNFNKVVTYRDKLQNKIADGTFTHKDGERLAIIDRMLSMNRQEKDFADNEIRGWYNDWFNFAKENNLIDSHIDNYVRRIWKIPKEYKDAEVRWDGKSTTGFKLKPASGNPRTLDSIIDGWELGMELTTEGVIPNLREYANDVGIAGANRKYIDYLKGFTTDIDGKGLIIESKSKKPPEGGSYKEIRTHGFATPGMHMWARNDIADIINKMGDQNLADIWNTPILKGIMKLNATIKSTKLSVSLFHHFAGMRSWVFGMGAKMGLKKRLNPIGAYKRGLDKIATEAGIPNKPNYEHLGPVVSLLAKNGMTLGRMQDFDEAMLRDSFFEDILGKGTGKVSKLGLDTVKALRRMRRKFTTGLFTRMFAGLKAEGGALDLAYRIGKMEKDLKRGLTDAEVNDLAKKTARLMNADFGGLNLERRGRSKNWQKVAQLSLLAPDWCTTSDTRAMTKTGWKYYHELKVGVDEILAFDPDINAFRWSILKDMYVNENYDGLMTVVRSFNRAIKTTPDHKTFAWNINKKKYEILTAKNLNTAHRIPRTAAKGFYTFPVSPTFDDTLVKLVGWLVTDGCIKNYRYPCIGQSKPAMVAKIKKILPPGIMQNRVSVKAGAIGGINKNGKQIISNYDCYEFTIPEPYRTIIKEEGLYTGLNWNFLSKLTKPQLKLLYDTMMLGDGTGKGRFCGKEKEIFYMTMIQAMLGAPTTFYQQEKNCWRTCWVSNQSKYIGCVKTKTTENYSGTIWCPSVDTGFWFAEREGLCFVTGNTESNFRTFTGMLPHVNTMINRAIGDNPADKEMGKVYRHFWAGIGTRAVLSWAFTNFAIQYMFGDEKSRSDYIDFLAGQFNTVESIAKGRFADIDLTPIAKKVFNEQVHGRRPGISMFGHFKDILKVLGPMQLIKNKKSPIAGILVSSLSKSDWKGDKFTTIAELYKSGKLTLDNKYQGDPFNDNRNLWNIWPSILLYNIRQSFPIPMSEFVTAVEGENTYLGATAKSLGIDYRPTTHRSLGEFKYHDLTNKVNKLTKDLRDAQRIGDQEMIKAARQKIRDFGNFYKIKSQLGVTRSRLAPINARIKILKTREKLKGKLSDRDQEKYGELMDKKRAIYDKLYELLKRNK